jgi:putative SOS response-associated peptidase YedK
MCGRFTLTTPPEALAAIFGIGERLNIPPRYNVAPTQDVPVIFRDPDINDGRHMGMMRWGLVPAWAKSLTDTPLLINARLDGIATKPSFQASFRHRRCLIPADGFYEWQVQTKTPHLIRPKSGETFAFAGLWSVWNEAENPVRTVAIVTTGASGAMTALHARLPVILKPAFYAAWLGETALPPRTLLTPDHLAGDDLAFHPVSRRVNAVVHDDPSCLLPCEEAPPQGRLF